MKKTIKSKEKFNRTSTLTKIQRKYCHCLMEVRSNNNKSYIGKTKTPNKKSKTNIKSKKYDFKSFPYAVCYSTLRKSKKMHTTKKNKKLFHKILKPESTNCLMNYNMDNYTLKDIQSFAKEKDIPTMFRSKNKNKTLISYKKSSLITKLTKDYIDKKKSKKKSKKKRKVK